MCDFEAESYYWILNIDMHSVLPEKMRHIATLKRLYIWPRIGKGTKSHSRIPRPCRSVNAFCAATQHSWCCNHCNTVIQHIKTAVSSLCFPCQIAPKTLVQPFSHSRTQPSRLPALHGESSQLPPSKITSILGQFMARIYEWRGKPCKSNAKSTEKHLKHLEET